jgi:glycosyltransferase involved in cell wall biosynthesis
MIHLLDNDPRQFSEPENYKYNHGSLASVMININNELKKINLYSDADQAEWVGVCDPLNIGFKYQDKKSFIISCWETANTLSYYHLNSAKQSKQKLLGMSNQITNLWRKYGLNCETLHLGTDTEFWYPTKDKDKDKFVFILPLATFTRSAIDLTLEAFSIAFKNNKDVVLKLKDTGSSPRFLQKIKEFQTMGLNIEHYTGRWSMQELRDFYSSAHVCLTLQRAASFGLIITESMSCNTLNLTGNIQPFNEIVNKEVSVMLDSVGLASIPQSADYLVHEWGLMNSYPNFDYPEEPLFYHFDKNQYAEKMLECYNQWTNKYSKIDYRQYIKDNFTWEKTAKNLIEFLKDNQ